MRSAAIIFHANSIEDYGNKQSKEMPFMCKMIKTQAIQPNAWRLLLSLAISFLPLMAIAKQPFAVISIRDYQEIGASDLHLFLYSLDGKLIKQLTSEIGVDDKLPMIDSEAKSVLFLRQAADASKKIEEGWYILDLVTYQVKKASATDLEDEKKHHQPTIQPLEFTWPSDKSFAPAPAFGSGVVSCESSNGNYRLVRKPNPLYSDSTTSVDQGPFLFFLQSKNRPADLLPLASLPGYKSYFTPDDFLELNGNPFVLAPDFAALFMSRHMNSTTGNVLWGLDLKAKRWVVMSYNAGLLYSVPGRTGVILIHDSRYENLGQSHLSVNCGYLEVWDGAFHCVRLGPPTSLFHGAAIYFEPNKTLILRDPEFGS